MVEKIDQLISEVNGLFSSNGRTDEFKKNGRIQVKVGLGRSLIGNLIGYDMLNYFFDAETRILGQLNAKIFLHDNITDDTVRVAEIGYDHGAAGSLENTLFGVKPCFNKDKDPYSAQEPVLKNPADLKNLRIPDFFNTDPMPAIHKTYNEIKRILDGRLNVTFPGWCRGTWSVACFVRGFTDIYMDLVERPEFVKELLDFIAESRINWEKQRSAFVGMAPDDPENMYTNCYVDYRRVHVSDIYNDEVDGNMMGPEMYNDIILPSEKKLADFYGGVRYYHSCGNLTPFLPSICEHKNLKMLHVSPWTNVEKAASTISGKNIILQVCLHPEQDVFGLNENEIYDKVSAIVDAAGENKIWICADAIYSGNINKVKQWVKIARKAVGR